MWFGFFYLSVSTTGEEANFYLIFFFLLFFLVFFCLSFRKKKDKKRPKRIKGKRIQTRPIMEGPLKQEDHTQLENSKWSTSFVSHLLSFNKGIDELFLKKRRVHFAKQNGVRRGRVAEWLKASDCNSVEIFSS